MVKIPKELAPDPSLKVHKGNLKEYFTCMAERMRIYQRKEVLKHDAPWTKDQAFLNFRFTNVYRELDKESVWLIENIIKNDKKYPTKFDKFWAIVFYRVFNRHDVFTYAKEYGIDGVPTYKEFDAEQFREKLNNVHRDGKVPIWTAAYMKTTNGVKSDTKHDFFIDRVLIPFKADAKNLWRQIKNAESGEEISNIIQQIYTFSGFMAYEVYCDLDYGSLTKFDQNDFTNAGPGAIAGASLLFPATVAENRNKGTIEVIEYLRDNWKAIIEQFGIKMPLYRRNKYKGELTLREIEHWLCEYSKYWRIKNNVGRQRVYKKGRGELK